MANRKDRFSEEKFFECRENCRLEREYLEELAETGGTIREMKIEIVVRLSPESFMPFFWVE